MEATESALETEGRNLGCLGQSRPGPLNKCLCWIKALRTRDESIQWMRKNGHCQEQEELQKRSGRVEQIGYLWSGVDSHSPRYRFLKSIHAELHTSISPILFASSTIDIRKVIESMYCEIAKVVSNPESGRSCLAAASGNDGTPRVDVKQTRLWRAISFHSTFVHSAGRQ